MRHIHVGNRSNAVQTRPGAACFVCRTYESMRAEAPAVRDLARDVRESGVRDIVLLGMGGSSLAPEVFSLTFPAPSGQRFFVLDSTDPAFIQHIERSIDLAHTLFIVASKSGKTIETLPRMMGFEAAGAAPVFANGTLYVMTESTLYAIQAPK